MSEIVYCAFPQILYSTGMCRAQRIISTVLCRSLSLVYGLCDLLYVNLFMRLGRGGSLSKIKHCTVTKKNKMATLKTQNRNSLENEILSSSNFDPEKYLMLDKMLGFVLAIIRLIFPRDGGSLLSTLSHFEIPVGKA